MAHYVGLCLTLSMLFSQTLIRANMMTNMLIQGAIGASSSIATQPLTVELHAIQKAFAANSTLLINQINAINKSQKTIEAQIIKAAQRSLTGALNNIDTLLSEQTSNAQMTLDYIMSMNSQQIPSAQCLTQAPLMDQYFSQATMNTPEGVIWKDVFQLGFWQYNPETDSFWQLHPTPWFNAEHNNSPQAFQNSIFTEWICKKTYEIRCSIKIYHIEYPSIVGIIFGKNRWISGDMDGAQRYATISLVTQNNQGGIWSFAQPIINGNQTTYPTDVIANAQATSLSTVNADRIKSIEDAPLEYNLLIKVTKYTVDYKIWNNAEKEPAQYSTISINQATQVNLFQGLGFISVGAIAEFKLLSPQECLFLQPAIQKFNEQNSASLLDNQGA